MQMKEQVELLMENCWELFVEQTSDLPSPSAEELAAQRDLEVRRETGDTRKLSVVLAAFVVPWPLFVRCLSGHLCMCLKDTWIWC